MSLVVFKFTECKGRVATQKIRQPCMQLRLGKREREGTSAMFPAALGGGKIIGRADGMT